MRIIHCLISQEGGNAPVINFENTVRSLIKDDNVELTASIPEAPVMPSSSLGLNRSLEPHFRSFDLQSWPIMDNIEYTYFC